MSSPYKKPKSPLTMQIGKRIAHIRKEKGLSQQDVEDLSIVDGESKIKYRTLSLIEQGYGEPKISTLNTIANTLKTPLSQLVDFNQHLHNQGRKKSLILDSIIQDIKMQDEDFLKIVHQQIKLLLQIKKS